MSSDIDKIKSEYGKALLIGEHIPQDADSAVKLLEKAVKLKNSNAKRFLALEYISGEHLEQDIEKGIALLTECADSGDVIACYRSMIQKSAWHVCSSRLLLSLAS